MHTTSRILVPALAAIALAAPVLGGTSAAAQEFPVRPVRLLVPSTPGGSVDGLSRLLGERLGDRWGQQVVVDNRPGAGGAIAGDVAAKANPDGHTLFMGTVASLASNVTLARKLPYDPRKDYAPLTLVARQDLVLVVNPTVPAKTVKELLGLAKSQPGKLSFASAGVGTGGHLSGELFKLLAGVDVVHVPYRGVAPAFIDVINGQVAMTFSSISSGRQHIGTGKVRGLATTGDTRSAVLPDLPTMIEAGVADYESSTWYGLVVPAATPAALTRRIAADIVSVLADKQVRARIEKMGAVPVGNQPDQFGRFIAAEIDKWAKVIRAAGIAGR